MSEPSDFDSLTHKPGDQVVICSTNPLHARSLAEIERITEAGTVWIGIFGFRRDGKAIGRKYALRDRAPELLEQLERSNMADRIYWSVLRRCRGSDPIGWSDFATDQLKSLADRLDPQKP